MIHHERLRPPSHDYPADEWNVIEKTAAQRRNAWENKVPVGTASLGSLAVAASDGFFYLGGSGSACTIRITAMCRR
jgi:hypothetical protein